MFNPYENIVIGNFLYGLGLAMGRRSRPADGCVNLLQQTPADPALGDVMLQFPGVWRLIEFKRSGGDEEKEKEKRKMFLAATRPRSGQQHLRRISEQVHWYMLSGSSDPDPPQDLKLMRARPYLKPPGEDGLAIDAFIEQLVDDACSGNFTDMDELGDYMAIIKTFAGVRNFNCGGFLVGVNATAGGSDGRGGGGITYLPVANFADLRETARMIKERYLETQRRLAVLLELETSRALERSVAARERTRERLNPGKDLGRSLGD